MQINFLVALSLYHPNFLYKRKWRFQFSVNCQITCASLRLWLNEMHKIELKILRAWKHNLVKCVKLRIFLLSLFDFAYPVFSFLSKFCVALKFSLRNFQPSTYNDNSLETGTYYHLRVIKCSQFRHSFIFLGIPVKHGSVRPKSGYSKQWLMWRAFAPSHPFISAENEGTRAARSCVVKTQDSQLRIFYSRMGPSRFSNIL